MKLAAGLLKYLGLLAVYVILCLLYQISQCMKTKRMVYRSVVLECCYMVLWCLISVKQ